MVENFSRSAYVISGLEGHVEPKDGGSTSVTDNQLLITGKNLKLSHKESFFIWQGLFNTNKQGSLPQRLTKALLYGEMPDETLET